MFSVAVDGALERLGLRRRAVDGRGFAFSFEGPFVVGADGFGAGSCADIICFARFINVRGSDAG